MSEALIQDFIDTSDFSKYPQINELLRKLIDEGVVDEIAVRNVIIKKKYFMYLKQKGKYAFAAIYELAHEYNLSESAIKNIVYK